MGNDSNIKRPRISQKSLDRLDSLLERHFGVDPEHVSYEGKIQLLMGRYDAGEGVDDQDEDAVDDENGATRITA